VVNVSVVIRVNIPDHLFAAPVVAPRIDDVITVRVFKSSEDIASAVQ
jgi:hypothetical protein